jgi:hypothetical protein
MNLTSDKIKQHVEIIRNGALIFLIDTARHFKRTGDTVIHGEAKATYAAPEIIKCRLITRSGSESSNIAAQPREVHQSSFVGLYRMQVPYESDISEGDQIEYTDKVTDKTKLFDVIFAPAKHEYSAAVIIQLQEVK